MKRNAPLLLALAYVIGTAAYLWIRFPHGTLAGNLEASAFVAALYAPLVLLVWAQGRER